MHFKLEYNKELSNMYNQGIINENTILNFAKQYYEGFTLMKGILE